MKKLVSILLVMIMVCSVCVVTAFAEVPPEDKFYDRFVEKYGEAMHYQEFQTHYDNNGEIDWVVVTAYTEMVIVDPIDGGCYNCQFNGDFVFHEKNLYAPFVTSHCIYDPKKDEYIDITKVDFNEYEDLKNHVRTYYFASLIGDADNDNDVTIMDATEVQRIVAKLSHLYFGDCVADFNRDDSVDILDATAIQMHIAGLDNKPTYNEEMIYAEFNNMYGVDTGIEEIPFEVLCSDDKVSKIRSERFGVIIKSKEQYDSVYYPELEEEGFISDEFFEDKWIVVSGCRVTDAEMVADITYLGVRGNTLFMRAERVLNDTNGVMEPIAPMYHSIVAVDKDALAEVSEIIWL